MSTSQSTINYVADPRADVVLRSSDGKDFAVRRLSLQANSEAFDNMFDSLAGEAVAMKCKNTGLPVVQMTEGGSRLALLLTFIVRDQTRPRWGEVSVDVAADLYETSAKFGADTVKESATARLEVLATADPVGVLGPALAFGDLRLTRVALAKMDRDFRWVYLAGHTDAKSGYVSVGSPARVSDLPSKWIERISTKTLLCLFRLEEDVFIKRLTWTQLASDFKFD